MEKPAKIVAQIYGYAVCLIAVITFLFSFIALMNAIVDMDDPLHAGWTAPGSPSLASFENYKMDILKSSQNTDVTTKASYVPDDKTLRAMYDAAKADKIQKVKHQARQSVIIGGLLIVISVVLFASHWQWVKRQRSQTT